MGGVHDSLKRIRDVSKIQNEQIIIVKCSFRTRNYCSEILSFDLVHKRSWPVTLRVTVHDKRDNSKKSKKRHGPPSLSSTSEDKSSEENHRTKKLKRRTNNDENISPKITNIQPLLENNLNLRASSIIPDFDPKSMDMNEWIEIIQYYANSYNWPDSHHNQLSNVKQIKRNGKDMVRYLHRK
ncbi:hypothetical protein ABEB36_009434 [Hypothenemus hampei]|uniref:Uncharacterized protein n=1 Tax=Hypothenemus hampei TaxID=57062 RepID=A0ABD1EGB5_HYPHA